jgi:hypothetical protein
VSDGLTSKGEERGVRRLLADLTPGHPREGGERRGTECRGDEEIERGGERGEACPG